MKIRLVARDKGSSPLRYRMGVLASLLLLTAGVPRLHAQESSFPGYAMTTEDVSPVFNGWERNPDGTFSMWFGYFNRNTEEEFEVPLGPANNFDLGNGDQGQPSHFYPRVRW